MLWTSERREPWTVTSRTVRILFNTCCTRASSSPCLRPNVACSLRLKWDSENPALAVPGGYSLCLPSIHSASLPSWRTRPLLKFPRPHTGIRQSTAFVGLSKKVSLFLLRFNRTVARTELHLFSDSSLHQHLAASTPTTPSRVTKMFNSKISPLIGSSNTGAASTGFPDKRKSTPCRPPTTTNLLLPISRSSPHPPRH